MKSIRNVEKVFTKKKYNNIMRKKYNPLKANFCEREGLPMKEKEGDNLRKLLEKICEDFNIKDSKEVIDEFIERQQ